MADLDIVDENDNVIGREPYEKVHSEGLRHRSVQIFVFQEPEWETLLVTQRAGKQEVSALKLQHSAAGHVKLGQSYLETALAELKEELFYDMTELPSGITLVEICRYKNDTRKTNRENTRLFSTNYSRQFSLDPQEVERVFWQSRHEIWEDMDSNSDKYTTSFRNAMQNFKIYKSELSF